MKRDLKPYKIVGAYDSETTNYDDSGVQIAFPILHQLGILHDHDLVDVTVENVEDVVEISMYRDALDLYSALDDLINSSLDYVPVVMCHNLAFDMYGLSAWLNRHEVKVLAKSERKPITFTILEDGKPVLVIWDTLVFTMQSLERMGNDCGYSKGVGEWDYSLVRTNATPLTPEEVDYAKRDIFTLFAWFGWWLRRNPDIKPEKLALNVVTKTGIVRERRQVRFADLKGKGLKDKVGQYWLKRNMFEVPKSDDELFTMMASTRGGFTFCSSKNASVAFDLVGSDRVIAGFDATSQHPAQLVSHLYPHSFKARPAYVLEAAFELVSKVSLQRILEKWEKPFPVAFYGCFEFENLRPKDGSIFKDCGIFPLASARYKTKEQLEYDEDNGDKVNYVAHMSYRDYTDSAVDAECAFGKIVSARRARLFITELTAWEICQCYEFDSVRAISGYSTGHFCKPSDLDVISVMQFYKAKNAFKIAREEFYETHTITNKKDLIELGIAPIVVTEMEEGSISAGDVEATYMGLKADLNAIFGISCSNQYRRDMVLTATGITYEGAFGICNEPKTPKVWYQFGQRIVGWSRIAQIVAITLIMPHCDTLINGDTDSIKVLCQKKDLRKLGDSLKLLEDAIDKGKDATCKRVRAAYPTLFDPLEGIGYYVQEFIADRFCASWNKAYAMQGYNKHEDARRFSFTLAGIPTRRRSDKIASFIGVNGLADRLYSLGWSFKRICDIFLGFNVTYANDVLRLNGRRFPEWGSSVYLHVTDYLGEDALVAQPAALALYPMSKMINNTEIAENANNSLIALRNDPEVNLAPKLICSRGVVDLDLEGIFDA